MRVVADGADRAALGGREHDGCVEGDAPRGVGQAADADGGVGKVGLGVLAGGFDGVEDRSAVGEARPPGAVGVLAE